MQVECACGMRNARAASGSDVRVREDDADGRAFDWRRARGAPRYESERRARRGDETRREETRRRSDERRKYAYRAENSHCTVVCTAHVNERREERERMLSYVQRTELVSAAWKSVDEQCCAPSLNLILNLNLTLRARGTRALGLYSTTRLYREHTRE